MDPWVWPTVIGGVLGLVALIYKLVTLAIERVEKRLDEHIAEDIKVHERVVKLETHREVDGSEIAELRERTRNMRHDILGEVTKTMLGWYTDAIERLMKLFKT